MSMIDPLDPVAAALLRAGMQSPELGGDPDLWRRVYADVAERHQAHLTAEEQRRRLEHENALRRSPAA